MADKVKILVIDDEEDICHFTKSILEKTGRFEVFSSTNPVTGISLAKAHKPDLILLDVFMPQMDGSKVAESLLHEESTKSIPIAFLTAIVQQKDVDKGAGSIGGRYFIPKPVAPKELITRIKEILKLQD
ncbi:MAG: response regulator [Candidatus Omnitrophica bacterium]|nr:response regulator [Candidatus Omnitrophota bacterium]